MSYNRNVMAAVFLKLARARPHSNSSSIFCCVATMSDGCKKFDHKSFNEFLVVVDETSIVFDRLMMEAKANRQSLVDHPSITSLSPSIFYLSPIYHPSITSISTIYHPSITHRSPIAHPSITQTSPLYRQSTAHRSFMYRKCDENVHCCLPHVHV